MSDTGFRSRASALGARVFVAVLVFVAPILTIIALLAIGLNEALWEFFADAVATNNPGSVCPGPWAPAVIMLSFAAAIGYPTMLIARRRALRRTGQSKPPA